MNSILCIALSLCSLLCPDLGVVSLTSVHASPLVIQGCEQTKIDRLIHDFNDLPEVITTTVKNLSIRCVTETFPYGFHVQKIDSHVTLRLGRREPISPRRTLYRLAHLSESERTSIFQRRGLIHASLLIVTAQTQWHLDPRFRKVNGWDERGLHAENEDAWAYSRPLGQQSALYDFITFGEEWFIRPPRRTSSPDNRVECQSFSKGRFFSQLFHPDQPDLPPKHCESFWHWNTLHPSAEILFTAPTSSPISSFGHLALLLRRNDAQHPEHLDPVYQYVGLVPIEGGRKSLSDSLLSEIPLILQTDSYIRFDRQNRLREDRRLYRFRVKLSSSELTWLKARLWEQLRRFQTPYL